MLQAELINGDVKENIKIIRKELGFDTSPSSIITNSDMQLLKDKNLFMLITKAAMIRPRIEKVGRLMAEATLDEIIKQRIMSYPSIVGFVTTIFGIGDSLFKVNDLLTSDDPNGYLIDTLKDTYPEFHGTLDMITSAISQMTPTNR